VIRCCDGQIGASVERILKRDPLVRSPVGQLQDLQFIAAIIEFNSGKSTG